MTEDIKKKIQTHYQKGQGSIQDLARIYRVDVSEILDVVGESGLKAVAFQGDLIDQSEAGKVPVNPTGERYDIPYTYN